MSELRDLVANQPLFAGLEPKQLDLLLPGASLDRVRPNTSLFNDNDAPEYLMLLVEGAVELFTGISGRRTTVELAWRPTPLMLSSVATNSRFNLAGRTVVRSRIVALRGPTLRAELARGGAFAAGVARPLAHEMDRLVRQLGNLRLRVGPQQLGPILIKIIDSAADDTRVKFPVPKSTLASYFGMTIQEFYRAMIRLSTKGFNAKGDNIFITDRRALEDFCS